MKRRFIYIAATICTVSALNTISAFAAVRTDTYSKDTSYIEEVTGNVEIGRKTSVLISDENARSVTTKNVKINKQRIDNCGKVTISDKTEEKYKNVKTPVLVTLNVDIDTPIVSGDTDVSFEHEVTRETEDCNIGRMYIYDIHYSNPIRIPKVN